MRKTTNAASPARLIAALFAAPVIAHAAVATHSFGMSSPAASGPATRTTTTGTEVTAPAPASSGTTSSGSSGTDAGTVIQPTNTTKVDQRNAQTNDAVQANRASGNTAASQMASAASGGPTTQGSSGSSTVNSVTGTTTTGSAGSTTGGTTGTGAPTVTGANGLLGGIGIVVNSGEPTVDANGNIIAGPGAYSANAATTSYAASSQYIQPYNGVANADVVVADNTMNQVIGTAQRDRKRVGRNGQLLYSIAPRTSVDRSREVPDDGPTPALTGPLAR